ncbi:hypothetical protein BJ741DRAFT_629283 [Chytriomyces cf. hyalinus JEL632]|nr:hypothetical protein BJ741DRAFT_629283 [Chytriomyces cf. hyalinus JEL632]
MRNASLTSFSTEYVRSLLLLGCFCWTLACLYGLLSTCLSFVGLGILIPSELFPSLNAYVNLMHACAYSVACLLAVVLLAMKMELEGGYSKLFASSYQSTNYSSQSKEESSWLQNETKH